MLKIQFHGPMLLMILTVKKCLEFFMKKLQKTNEQKIRIEKEKRKKKTNFMSNGKIMIVYLIAALIKIMLNEIPLHKKLSVLS